MGHEDCFKISEYLMTTEIVIRDILNSVSCVNTRVNNLAGDSTEDLALKAQMPKTQRNYVHIRINQPANMELLTQSKLIQPLEFRIFPCDGHFICVVIRALFYPLITANKSRLAAGVRGVSRVSSGQTKYSQINYVIKHRQKPRELIPTPLAIMLMAAEVSPQMFETSIQKKVSRNDNFVVVKTFSSNAAFIVLFNGH